MDAIPELTNVEPTAADETHAPAGGTCPSCGAPHDTSDSFCTACGREFHTATQTRAAQNNVRQGDAAGDKASPKKYFRCKNCGAEVATDPDMRSYICAFCDSTYVVEFSPEESGRKAPEFVIGFEVTPTQAQEKFRNWLSHNPWFRPGDLSEATIEEKLKGVYLPFWTFPMLAESNWSTKIGEHWYRTETYTTRVNGKTVTRTRRVQETEWWDLAGQHHQYYFGFLVSGSRGLPQKEAERIKPFYLQGLKRYKPFYLAGWLAEEYSVDEEKAISICRNVFEREEQKNIAKFMPGDTYRGLVSRTRFSHASSDLCLLPIYILSYRYNTKVYRFLLNGQTGRMAGDKPISKKRVISAALIVLFLVLMIILFFMFK